jgi:hypothetical protein
MRAYPATPTGLTDAGHGACLRGAELRSSSPSITVLALIGLEVPPHR